MEEQTESESDNLKQANSGLHDKHDGEIVAEPGKSVIADESGIGAELSDSQMDHNKTDLDMSYSTNHTSMGGSKLDDVSLSANHASVEGAKLDFDMANSNNHTSMEDLITPDKNKSENSFSVSIMKKDDSGIYSERSPNGGSITKENSDASLSESISESLDENLLLSNATPMDTDAAEVDINVTNNSVSNATDNNVITFSKMPGEAVTESKTITAAKTSSESFDIINADGKTVDESADIIYDDKNKLDNAIGNSAMSNDLKHSDALNIKTPDEVVEHEMVDKSDKSSTLVEHAESDPVEKEGGGKDLKETIEEAVASTSDIVSSKTEKVESESVAETESVTDKANDEHKSDCDNADEVTTSEQAVKSQTEEKKKRRTRRYVFHDGSSSSSSNSPSDDEVRAIPRRRRRNRLLDSDSDMDSDDDIGGDKKSSSESEDGVEDTVPLTQYGAPKQKWRAMFDVRDRELGYSCKKYDYYFQQKVQGSLQMVQRFELQYKMDHHEGCVNALHFNRIGTLLASGSDDLNIVIWNWIQNRPALIYDSGHRSNVFQAKFMPFSGDCHVVSCARDGQVRLADLSSTGVCKGTKKLAQHRGAAHKLALEFDSPHLFLSCGEDAVTFEVDLRQDKPNKLVTTKEKGKKVAMYSIHTNPCNSFEFCVGGRDHYIRIYDKRKIVEEDEENNGVLKKFCPDHLVDSELKANVTCACYNWNGTEVLGSYNDEDIYLFSNEHSDGSNYIHKYLGHRNNQTVKGVNFYGPHSEFVVSGSDCGHIFLWDKDTENIVQYMDGDDGGVINVLEPHPYAPVLATSGLDHDVKIWAPTAEKPTTLKGLNKVMKRNSRQREEEKENGGGMLDGQMLWFIMHQLRRGRRRREREENADPDGELELSSDSSIEEDSDPGFDDPENRLREGISCNPS